MAEDALKKRPESYVLIIQHRLELGRQHEGDIVKFGLDPKKVQVASVFTVARHLDKYTEPPCLLVVDECHLAKADSWESVIRHMNTHTIGCSATPCRLDNKPLNSIFDAMVQGVSHKWLQEHGYLAPYEYFAPLEVDVSNLTKRGGDYATEALEDLVCNRTIYGDVIGSYQKLAAGKRGIAFCVSVRHSQEVTEAFNAAGIPAAHLDGKMPKKARSDIMQQFRDGKILILSSCNIISEGISVNECDCCLMLRPTDSVALWIQQVCRCLRTDPNNPGKVATILDFVGGYTRMGLPDDPREYSLENGVTRKPTFRPDGLLNLRVCDHCFKTYEAPAPKCPFCGAEYTLKPRELKMIEDIQLKKIEAVERQKERDRIDQAKMDVRKARSYEDFLQIALANGYKSPKYWARMRCKLRGYKVPNT